MSNFFKAGFFVGGAALLNDVNDSVVTGAPDALGLGFDYGGGARAGDMAVLNDAEALALSDTGVGTLFGGMYQRVKFSASITTLKRGQIVFWDLSSGALNHQVTNVEATGAGLTAGVVINKNAGVTAGNWAWIQRAGIATVLYRATLSNTGTPAAGNSVFIALAGAGADNATFDDLGGIAPVTLNFAKFAGIAIDAPVGGSLKKVLLRLGIMDRP